MLKDIRITGMTAFTKREIEDIYQPYVGRTITLDTAWLIAGQLTERYHQAGYFLSRAFVTAQTVEGGIINLRMVEGYIGQVKLEGPLAEQSVVQGWIARLQAERPLTVSRLESILLQLNDLPGVSLRAVLEPIEGAHDGAVRLTLLPQAVHDKAQVGFDNFGSRFLGPYEFSAQYQTSLLPLQQTTVSVLNSVPYDDLHFGQLQHRAAVYPGLDLEVYAGITNANPGYTLKQNNILTDSFLFGVAADYTLIRQRQENLLARVAFESRTTHSNILGTSLTRDEIRALRTGLSYQRGDNWGGSNQLDVTLSQGIDGLGATGAGSRDLSRADAVADFTKAEFHFTRMQTIAAGWQAVLGASGQYSPDPLFSSEEFGYGGQAFGRAYDDSEITGDQGLAGSLELRYAALDPWQGLQAIPYGFYDVGTVWNYGSAQASQASGSSAGVGVNLVSDLGISATLGVAFPLTRRVETPLDGNGKNPRYSFKLS